ncbi:DUF3658 domain-containing protein [Anaerovorax odorimutans]|uniref:DUF3658 domain-containing protein n=1 Tax=Anaerovorax odorimutans TaxID=109327 RepID=UPI00040225F9|nr:DUF3658 domain-containing protein [Anaerovorax odorimutans]
MFMVELAFNESAGGGLKLAKSMKHGKEYSSGIAAVEKGSKQKTRNKNKTYKWSGLTMEGSSMDVESFSLYLDIGDISNLHTGMESRKNVIKDLYNHYSDVSDEIWETNQHALERIKEAGSTLEPIRMWISLNDPNEVCSLYFICHLMIKSNIPLSVVRIPAWIEMDNYNIRYRNTGEIPAEEFGKLIKYEESISQCQRETYANMWKELVNENASLRVIVNGNLISVPVDFYDFALRENMPEEEIRIGQLIGKTLNQISGVVDSWLFMRIQAMLQSEELIEVAPSNDDHPYSVIIKKNKI